MTYSPEGGADAEGPNASLPEGGVAQNNALAGELKNTAPGAYAATQSPQAGGQPAAPSTPPVPAGALPSVSSQPTPPMYMRNQGPDLNELFMDRQLEPVQTWRERLNTWAQHPHAGPALKTLADLANKDLKRHGGQ